MKRFYREQTLYLSRLDRLEIGFRRAMAKEKNRYIRQVAEKLENGGQAFELEQMEHARNVRDLIIAQTMRTIPVFAQAQAAQLGRKAVADSPMFFDRLIDQWLVQRVMDESSNIAATATSDIIKVVRDGIGSGIGSLQIGRNIRKLTAFTPWRAESIARTEVGSAASFATAQTAKQAAQDYGLSLHKFWVPTKDERTRMSHRDMAKHPGIDLEARFDVGGVSMDRPLDPAGGAANVINCRCVMVHREVESGDDQE